MFTGVQVGRRVAFEEYSRVRLAEPAHVACSQPLHYNNANPWGAVVHLCCDRTLSFAERRVPCTLRI